MNPVFVVLDGPMDGLRFELNKPEMSIGRELSNAIFLPLDQAVSGYHAKIRTKQGAYWLEDVGSTYGTFIGDRTSKISKETQIKMNETFRLGPDTRLVLKPSDVAQTLKPDSDDLTQLILEFIHSAFETRSIDIGEEIRLNWEKLQKEENADVRRKEAFNMLAAIILRIQSQHSTFSSDDISSIQSFVNSNMVRIIDEIDRRENIERKSKKDERLQEIWDVIGALLDTNSLKILYVAKKFSEGLHHFFVGLEHLIIGMTKLNGGLLQRGLDALGIDSGSVRNLMKQSAGPSVREAPWIGLRPTPRLTRTLTLALGMSLNDDSGKIGEIHLLLAILNDKDSVPVRAFTRHGIDVHDLLEKIKTIS